MPSGSFGTLQVLSIGTNMNLSTDPLISSAKDSISHQLVAVKKLPKPFSSAMLAKQALREVKLSRYLQHENVWSRPEIIRT